MQFAMISVIALILYWRPHDLVDATVKVVLVAVIQLLADLLRIERAEADILSGGRGLFRPCVRLRRFVSACSLADWFQSFAKSTVKFCGKLSAYSLQQSIRCRSL